MTETDKSIILKHKGGLSDGIVLMDLEWVENNNKQHLTQLSAARLNRGWDALSSFNALVCPPEPCFSDPNHIAFGGYDVIKFRNGGTAEAVINRFVDWLLPDDQIWVWAKSNARMFYALCQQYGVPNPIQVYNIGRKARLILQSGSPGIEIPSSAYKVIDYLNLIPPFPEHRAEADVEAMRLVCKELKLKKAEPVNITSTTEFRVEESDNQSTRWGPTQREININRILTSDYNYIYLKNSDVFHRRECKLWQNVRDSADIIGTVYYRTAAKSRRPCKKCNPEVFLEKEIERQNLIDKQEARTEQNRQNNELIVTYLADGTKTPIKRGRIVGWCQYEIHPGALTSNLLKKHGCLEKQCFHFRKNKNSNYWTEQEKLAIRKKRRKEQAASLKNQQRQQEDELAALADEWQDYLDEIGSDMYIVNVTREQTIQTTQTRDQKRNQNVFTVFYVSDNWFADGNRYPEFCNFVKNQHPGCRVNLRHIKDVDGRFVTTDQYFSRARK